jgi:hypothetical protein
MENNFDNISYLIILRALFIFSLLEKGWAVKKTKNKKNTFEIYKSIKNIY